MEARGVLRSVFASAPEDKAAPALGSDPNPVLLSTQTFGEVCSAAVRAITQIYDNSGGPQVHGSCTIVEVFAILLSHVVLDGLERLRLMQGRAESPPLTPCIDAT